MKQPPKLKVVWLNPKLLHAHIRFALKLRVPQPIPTWVRA